MVLDTVPRPVTVLHSDILDTTFLLTFPTAPDAIFRLIICRLACPTALQVCHPCLSLYRSAPRLSRRR